MKELHSVWPAGFSWKPKLSKNQYKNPPPLRWSKKKHPSILGHSNIRVSMKVMWNFTSEFKTENKTLKFYN